MCGTSLVFPKHLLHDSLIVLVRGLDEVGGRLQRGVWPAKGALIGVRPAAIHAIQCGIFD